MKCRVTFWMSPPHPDSAPYQVLGLMNLVDVDIKCFLFVTWPRYRSVTWLGGWGPLILSHHPARFGVHRSYVTGNNGVCSIGSNSNSNSNAEVPMPRFTNGWNIFLLKSSRNWGRETSSRPLFLFLKKLYIR